MKNIVRIIMAMCLPLAMQAQLVTRGVVKDAANNEPLAFAAVTIKGTTIGTSTDFDGRYSLRIPDAYKSGVLVISCVGYKFQQLNISTLKSNLEMMFALESDVNNLLEVAISAKSRAPFAIVKTAIERIPSNYPSRSYNYDLTYTDEQKTGKTPWKHSATLLYFDKQGYTRRDAFSVFKSCHYKTTSTKSTPVIRTIGDATTNLDQLLQLDVVRNNNNILDDSRLNDFDIKIDKTIVEAGDSLWLLTYENKKPAYLSSGDWNVSKATGTLLVRASDYAVLKHTTEIKTRVLNEVSRSLAVDTAAPSTSLREVTYKAETTYEKRNGVYCLKQISYSCPAKSQTSSLAVTGLKTEGVQVVDGREYLLKP